MEELLHKTIIKIEKDEDDGHLVFTDDKNEKYVYYAYGDCCSHSWFSNITGLKNLLGEEINEIIEREEWTKEEITKAEATGDYETLSLYGFVLKTNKGTCDIEFRNDSNGYYGGGCSFMGNNSYSKELEEIKGYF